MRAYVISTLGAFGRAYLSLSSRMSIFNKNYRCLKKLIKITYDLLISPF